MQPREPLREGDIEAAQAITHSHIAEYAEDGTMIIKTVLESLDSPTPRSRVNPFQLQASSSMAAQVYDEIPNLTPPPTPQPKRSRVGVIIQM
jgi:hypothetical protein